MYAKANTWVLLVGLSLALLACSSGSKKADAATAETKTNGLTKEQASQPLVKIGNTTITVGQFAEQLADQSPYLRARYNSPERRREFLDNLVRFELLAAEASKKGYDHLPDVDRTRKQMMIQEMMKAEFEDKIKLEDITDAEIKAYFDAHPDEYNKPEQVRASHILFRDRAAAQRALTQLLAAPTDAALFRRLAEQSNTDAETKDRLGDLRFFSRPAERQPTDPEIPAAVADAAFAIENIGDYARQVIQTDKGFHVVKLTGKRAAVHRTFEEAKRTIQQRLWREKRQKAVDDFVAQLRNEAHVQENLDLLGEVHVEVPADTGDDGMGMPPGMMGMPGMAHDDDEEAPAGRRPAPTRPGPHAAPR